LFPFQLILRSFEEIFVRNQHGQKFDRASIFFQAVKILESCCRL